MSPFLCNLIASKWYNCVSTANDTQLYHQLSNGMDPHLSPYAMRHDYRRSTDSRIVLCAGSHHMLTTWSAIRMALAR